MTAKRVHVSEGYDYDGRKEGDMNMAVSVADGSLGQPGWLGNPNPFNEWGREKGIELFERDLQWLCEASPVLRAKLLSMQNAKIACSCPEHLPCHVDVIVDKIHELANNSS